ncbi:MAG: bifunctional 5,10-methylenetetrahydrofolate dehydrogenase/5,10-methenyltetrahydrofolate cyclohydrolase [Alphaproteobacteria bacterium]|nr:bifunctional 5,10-methylenetetrahydrofolate dehydrogenase/5,10-methenyltetrahydrofolate cyclohydrolase [Alphaproteobacteria bacterium]
METKLLDGRALAGKIQEQVANELAVMQRVPKLVVVLVDPSEAIRIYVRNKLKRTAAVGIQTTVQELSPTVSTEQVVAIVKELNQDKLVDGILVQLPLPDHINTNTVIETIDPNKDVDGLTSVNLGRLMANMPYLVPCTPLGCLHLIHQAKADLTGLNAVVIGRSRLVGRPMAQLLLAENCTVTIAHSKTRNLAALCRTADILVSATGQPGLITDNYIKPGAIVIDVGISKTKDGHITGDVDMERAKGIAGWLTPVPGGVGPMTITMILTNMVQIIKQNLDNK